MYIHIEQISSSYGRTSSRVIATPWIHFPAVCDPNMQEEMIRWGLQSPWFRSGIPSDQMFFFSVDSGASTKNMENIFRTQRCLVKTSGFIWRKEKKGTVMYSTGQKNDTALLAGLFEHSIDSASEQAIKTFTILTTEIEIQDQKIQLPVVLPANKQQFWLSERSEYQSLIRCLKYYPEEITTSPFSGRPCFSGGTNIQLILPRPANK